MGDPERACTCSLGMIQNYRKRISGPLLDRIDINIEVPRVDYEKLTRAAPAESSAAIRRRVEMARARQGIGLPERRSPAMPIWVRRRFASTACSRRRASR